MNTENSNFTENISRVPLSTPLEKKHIVIIFVQLNKDWKELVEKMIRLFTTTPGNARIIHFSGFLTPLGK